MRAAGYPLPRPAGLEWIESVASQVSGEVEGGDDRLKVAARWGAHLMNSGYPKAHVLWAVQDGLDRAEIKMVRQTETMERMGISCGSDGQFASTRGT